MTGRSDVQWLPAAEERLRVTRKVDAPMAEVERVLRIAPERLIELAYDQPPEPDGLVISLRLVPSIAWLRVPVRVESWTPAHHGATIAIRWQATHLSRYFPVMDADLIASPGDGAGCQLILEGRYRPPLGLLGLLSDRLIGRFVAASTARRFVDRLSDRIQDGSIK